MKFVLNEYEGYAGPGHVETESKAAPAVMGQCPKLCSKCAEYCTRDEGHQGSCYCEAHK